MRNAMKWSAFVSQMGGELLPRAIKNLRWEEVLKNENSRLLKLLPLLFRCRSGSHVVGRDLWRINKFSVGGP